MGSKNKQKKTLKVVFIQEYPIMELGLTAEEYDEALRLQRVEALKLHGEADMIILSDDRAWWIIILFFKDDEVCMAVNKVLRDNQYLLKSERIGGWVALVYVLQGSASTSCLYRKMIRFIREAGYQVVTSGREVNPPEIFETIQV